MIETSVVFNTAADRADYLICRTQCKMKMQGSLFKKWEKGVIKCSKITSFFLLWFSTGHGASICYSKSF